MRTGILILVTIRKHSALKSKAISTGFVYTVGGAFIILCANELGWQLKGGEEQYMAFAKQYMDPEWIAGSFTLTEFAGTRILFQILIGSLLKVVEIPAGVFICRMLSYAGFAFAFGRLFQTLEFKWYWSLVCIQLFVMSPQCFFGYEWMVLSFEPKVIAYVFVILALDSSLKNQWSASGIWLSISMWFHFLVGGWMVVCLGLFLLGRRSWSEIRKFALPLFVIVTPLVFYLFGGYFNSAPLETEFDLNWVYGYYRLPHHIGIFVTPEFFMDKEAFGVILSFVTLTAALAFRRSFSGKLKVLNQLMVIALSITLLFVFVAWIDRYVADYALAGILKFYPFRLSSFAFFAMVVLIAGLIWQQSFILNKGGSIRTGIAVVALLLGVVQVINHVKDQFEPQFTDDYLEVVNFIRENVPEQSVFALINQPNNSSEYIAFIRLTERENFSVFKFVPGEKHKLNAWYKRQLLLEQVNNDNEMAEELSEAYGVTHLLSQTPIPSKQALYTSKQFFVYALR